MDGQSDRGATGNAQEAKMVEFLVTFLEIMLLFSPIWIILIFGILIDHDRP